MNNYGDEAAMEAATMADDFLSKGNIEAQRAWLRIASAVAENYSGHVTAIGPRGLCKKQNA